MERTSKADLVANIAVACSVALVESVFHELEKETYVGNFSAPLFLIWLRTAFCLLPYPLLLAVRRCSSSSARNDAKSTSALVAEDARATVSLLYGDDTASTWRRFLLVSLAFCTLWTAADFAWLRGIKLLTPATATSLLCTSAVWLYLAEPCLSGVPYRALKAAAMALAIGGVALVGYEEGYGARNYLGVVLVLGAAVGFAAYFALLKRVLGDRLASVEATLLFLFSIAAVSTALFWPLVVAGWYLGEEVVGGPPSSIPWRNLLANASISLLFVVLTTFGAVKASPLAVVFGDLLSIPFVFRQYFVHYSLMDTVMDITLRGDSFRWPILLGAVLISSGFVGVVLPDEWMGRRRVGDRQPLSHADTLPK